MAKSSLTAEKFYDELGDIYDEGRSRIREVESYISRAENIILAFTSLSGDPASGVWVDAICSAVQFDIVTRAFFNPAGLSSESMGPESQGYVSPGGLTILPKEEETLRRLTQHNSGVGLGMINLVRPELSGNGRNVVWL